MACRDCSERGYQRDLSLITPSQQTATRLKGKARKEARNAAAGSNASAATYRINVGEFVPMAETIANQKPKIEVPHALSQLFDRAIEAGKKAATWFQVSQSDDILDEGNQTHAHFVDMLRTAAAILQPLVKVLPRRPRPERRPPRTQVNPTQDMANAFSSLAIETGDVPEDLEEEPEPPTTREEPLDTLPPVESVEIKHHEAEIESEFFFAIQSFLTNLHELRDIVQETWFSYKDGKTDLVNASVIANTAIDLVRHAESEFDLLLKRPGEICKSLLQSGVSQNSSFSNHGSTATKASIVLPALLLLSQHPDLVKEDEVIEIIFPSSPMMPCSHDCSQVRWCFWPVYSGLRYYLDAVRTAKKPKIDIPIIDPIVFHPVGGVHDDTMRTLKPSEKLRHVALKHTKDIAIDEITRGMAYMYMHSVIPIWTTFCFQILLDIQDILTQANADGPFNELHERINRESGFKATLEWSRSSLFEPYGGTEEARKAMADDLKATKIVAGDPCNVLPPNPIRYFRIDEAGEWESDDDEGPGGGPCPDCTRCKRREFLGHRYPGQYSPNASFSYNPEWTNQHLHDHDSEDGHDHDHNHEHHNYTYDHDHNGHAAHGHTNDTHPSASEL